MDATKQDMVSQAARDAERSLVNHAQTPGFSVGVDGRTTRSVIDGQNDAISSGLMQIKPAEIVASDPQRFAAEAGSVPEIRFSRTSDGGYAPMRSKALEEALEDDLIGSIGWNLRNRLSANLFDSRSVAPPDKFLPSSDYTWVYSILRQAWYPMKKDAAWYEYPKIQYWVK